MLKDLEEVVRDNPMNTAQRDDAAPELEPLRDMMDRETEGAVSGTTFIPRSQSEQLLMLFQFMSEMKKEVSTLKARLDKTGDDSAEASYNTPQRKRQLKRTLSSGTKKRKRGEIQTITRCVTCILE